MKRASGMLLRIALFCRYAVIFQRRLNGEIGIEAGFLNLSLD
jgi:hypothetical protein